MRRVLRAAILALITVVVGVAGVTLRLIRPPARVPAAGVRKILLIRLDLLGDVVFSLAAARVLKLLFPASKLTMVTLPRTAGLAAASPDVDDVIPLDTNLVRSPRTLARLAAVHHLRGGLARLRLVPFDVALSLNGRTASLLAMLSRSAIRVGFGDEAYPFTLDKPIRPGRRCGRRRRHDTQLGLDLVQWLAPKSAPVSLDGSPRITVDPAAKTQIEIILRGQGIGPRDKLVVLQAGSGYGDFKRWPDRSFAELARRLDREGTRSVIAGGAAEVDLAAAIAQASPAISVAGRTTLPQLIALLDRAQLVISGDSGPLHLAAALGTSVIGIYGPTDPIVNGPRPWRGQPVAVLRHDLACGPCYSVRTRAECPLGDPICMRLVSVDRVMAAATMMLAGQRP